MSLQTLSTHPLVARLGKGRVAPESPIEQETLPRSQLPPIRCLGASHQSTLPTGTHSCMPFSSSLAATVVAAIMHLPSLSLKKGYKSLIPCSVSSLSACSITQLFIQDFTHSTRHFSFDLFPRVVTVSLSQ